jgi:hypothetical protein
MKERFSQARVLINALALPLPKGPIDHKWNESSYKMSPKAVRKHESMAVIPNPDPESLLESKNTSTQNSAIPDTLTDSSTE